MKIIYEPVTYVLEKEKDLIKLINDEYSDAFIAATAQYSELLKKLKNNCKGVVLGCRVNIIKGFKGDTILFVGDGVFHALMLKRTYKEKRVFTLNPFNLKIKEITDDDINVFDVRELKALNALKTAKKVGVIISTKKGQYLMKEALKLKTRLEKDGKVVYLFLCDNVNPDEFLNFQGLDVLVNTACPRLALDDYTKFPVPIVNYNNA